MLLSEISITLYLATSFYHPSLPAGLPGYILYPYSAVIDKFWLVVPLSRIRVNVRTSLMSSSLRVVTINEVKIRPSTDYLDYHSNRIYIYIYMYI